MALVKSKKRDGKKLRKAIRKQLQYFRRDIGYIVKLVQTSVSLTQKRKDLINLLTTVYEQQHILFETNIHSIPQGIVSLSQPFVRPIVLGKARARTEFGTKLHISLVDGFARIERLSFEPYNEAGDFFLIVDRYREGYGKYPRRILADKLYRNRESLAFCKENGILLTGPALGRPPKDRKLSRQAKQEEYQDICDHNIVEGTFGTGKTAYKLGRIPARLEVTSCCVIGIALLVLSLTKRLRSL